MNTVSRIPVFGRVKSLRTKLSLLSALLLACFAIFSSTFFPHEAEDHALAALRARAQSIAAMTAWNAGRALESNDGSALHAALECAKQNRDLSYAIVCDTAGALLLADGLENAAAASYLAPSPEGKMEKGAKVLKLSSPIESEGKTRGRLYLGVSLDALRAEVEEMTKTIVIGSLAIFVLGVSGVYGLSRLLTGPLVAMVNTVERIGRGDWMQRASVQTNDEIGLLASSFNLMVDKLSKAYSDLQQSEERYRNIYENSSIGIYRTTPEGKIVMANPALVEMLGYSSYEELSHHSVEENFKGEFDTREAFKNEIGKTGALKGRESAWTRRDGSVIFVREYAKTVRRPDGAILYFEGTVEDVTERKRAEELILLQQARFEELLRNAPVAIMLADANDCVIHANRYFERLFGHAEKDLIGRVIRDVIVPAHLRADSAGVPAPLIPEAASEQETERLRSDGTLIPVILYTIPVRMGGTCIGVFRIYVDQTERKRAHEIQSALLKDVTSTNKELNEFAYIVSHDLKAPLRAISSLTAWISTDYGEKCDEEGKELLRLLVLRTGRMHALIDGILQYSRVGRLHEEHVLVDLAVLLPEIVDLIAPPAHIHVHIQKDLPAIRGEKTRIQQVFQNLIGNAVTYIDKPQGEIEVTACREGGFWQFSVKDNGPGIEEKHFERIFQMFQTLKARDEFESTGVGLTIVKKIVEMNGGRVWVESIVGEGSTFSFTLPVESEA
jgi:two-component system, LuxR family, sensor kinase FixL